MKRPRSHRTGPFRVQRTRQLNPAPVSGGGQTRRPTHFDCQPTPSLRALLRCLASAASFKVPHRPQPARRLAEFDTIPQVEGTKSVDEGRGVSGAASIPPRLRF